MVSGQTWRMVTLPGLVPRRAQSIVSEALEDTRVVLVNGARQAGKSTLTRVVLYTGQQVAAKAVSGCGGSSTVF